MQKQVSFSLLLLLSAFALMFSSCVKQDFDLPPTRDIPVGEVVTIAELKAMYTNQDVKFDTAMSTYGIIVADETSGNIYRNSYIQDATGAINLRLKNPGGLYQGDSVRVYLEGLILGNYSGVMQLDSVDVDRNIVKLETGVLVEPTLVTIPELEGGAYNAQLIKLENVEFADNELGKTWSDAAGLTTQNRILKDCDNNTVIVRTSGYANFADQPLPEGNGTFIAIVSQFNNDIQLYVRDVTEIDLTGERCDGGGGGGGTGDPVTQFFVDFENQSDNVDISLEGWNNVATAGNRVWRGRSFDNNLYAQANAYNSTDPSNEAWLISPPIDLNAMDEPKLEFLSATAYWTHDGFSVLFSTDFDGSDITGATWSALSFNMPGSSNNNYEWVESGVIDLSGFSGTGYVAFRYQGAAPSQTGTFALEDIELYDGEPGGGGGGGGTDPVTLIQEDFESQADYQDISLPGWSNIDAEGNRLWRARVFDDNTYAQATAYNSTDPTNVTWMITPPIALDDMADPVLWFNSAVAYYTHDGLEVMISTDFDGENLNNATWQPLQCTLAGQGNNNYDWVESGQVSLANYSGIGYIAFKYSGSADAGQTCTFIIDDVNVADVTR